MHSIAHIVNPVKVGIKSDLYYAQPITFESMRQAKQLADGKVKVDLLTTQYPEEKEILPPDFIHTPNLERSVLDCGEFDVKRKLPLIQDILQRLYDGSDAEYLVYTNVDILVMPQFYLGLSQIIDKGHQAFIINRRRVEDIYTKPEELPTIVSQVGLPHPGFDCFVFHRSIFPNIKLGQISVGVPFIEIGLSHTLYCFGRNFKLFTDQHLTMHIGMEVIKKWGDQQYLAHNKKEFDQVKEYLLPKLDITNFPYFDLPWYKRYLSWIFNPAMQIGICFPLEWKRIKSKTKYSFNEFFFKFIDGWR